MAQDPSLLTSANPAQGTEIESANSEYDELVQYDPAYAPVSGNEEPDEMEQAHYDALYADFMEELYDNQSDNAVQMLKANGEIYNGVSKTAFMLLKSVYQKHESRNGPTPQAALFGEGGMIHTAVDEMFKFAQAYQIAGSDNQDQYNAAQMDMMRQVGEFLEKDRDDGAVGEAQDLMIEMDELGGGQPNGPVSRRDRESLEAIEFQDEMEAQENVALAGAREGDPAPQTPTQPPPPESGGLV